MMKTNQVKLSGTLLRELGMNRHAGYRALEWLEEANLIEVERHPGRSPVVTLLNNEEPGSVPAQEAGMA